MCFIGDQVLKGLVGLSPQEIAQFTAAGIMGRTPPRHDFYSLALGRERKLET
jgi:hypothetical protein